MTSERDRLRRAGLIGDNFAATADRLPAKQGMPEPPQAWRNQWELSQE